MVLISTLVVLHVLLWQCRSLTAGLKSLCENCVAPTALVHFVPLYPVLTHWANGFRRSAGCIVSAFGPPRLPQLSSHTGSEGLLHPVSGDSKN